MVADMAEATSDMLERWSDYERIGQPIDVVREMSRLALDIVLRCLFSIRLGHEYRTSFLTVQPALEDPVQVCFSRCTHKENNAVAQLE